MTNLFSHIDRFTYSQQGYDVPHCLLPFMIKDGDIDNIEKIKVLIEWHKRDHRKKLFTKLVLTLFNYLLGVSLITVG